VINVRRTQRSFLLSHVSFTPGAVFRLHLIPNGRHFWSLEESDSFNALLEDVLAE